MLFGQSLWHNYSIFGNVFRKSKSLVSGGLEKVFFLILCWHTPLSLYFVCSGRLTSTRSQFFLASSYSYPGAVIKSWQGTFSIASPDVPNLRNLDHFESQHSIQVQPLELSKIENSKYECRMSNECQNLLFVVVSKLWNFFQSIDVLLQFFHKISEFATYIPSQTNVNIWSNRW